jgi:putative addiction module component (TIGR02574 family)
MALWDSLTDADRAQALELTDVQRAELDRRWAAHVANPESAIDWADIRRDLLA